MKIRLNVLIPILSILLPSSASHAQWYTDGVPLCKADTTQSLPTIVSDGAGGAIVTWEDYRSGTNYDIYVQRIDASGVVRWTADGVALCTAANDQRFPWIELDGGGGAIVTWYDYRISVNPDIYAQRIDASGTIRWMADGVALCTEVGNQMHPKIVLDGLGGAIVTWQDNRSFTGYDIYAQRISDAGAVQWTADGVALSTASNAQQFPRIVSDGSGGAIVTWEDNRIATNSDVYARRIDASGAVQWTADGVLLCGAADTQFLAAIASDGVGGAFVSWNDYRNGVDGDIYAQLIDASGSVQWAANGVALCTQANDQFNPAITPDDAGGAIVTWDDHRGGATADIYAQRIDVLGDVQWTGDGVALSTAVGDQIFPMITSDGAGGAIVAWIDGQNGGDDIYAQRINGSGTAQWKPDGVPICTDVAGQWFQRIVSDGSGGAIVTWRDYRNGNYDIYAQRVGPDGEIPTGVGRTPSAFLVSLTPNYPNPFSAGTAIDLDIRGVAVVEVQVFNVAGRRVRRIEIGRVEAGSRRLTFDGLDDEGRPLPSGVYFYHVKAAGETLTRKMVIAR